MKVDGWAIVPEGDDRICFTDGPLTDGAIWQIYKTRAAAEEFCRQIFADAKYKVVQVTISSHVVLA